MPNANVSFPHLVNTLNAYVIKKGNVGADGPRLLASDEVELRYSAAANPVDPVGAGSINSTSQNWPLNADITQFSAAVVRTVFRRPICGRYSRDCARSTDPVRISYRRYSWAEMQLSNTSA